MNGAPASFRRAMVLWLLRREPLHRALPHRKLPPPMRTFWICLWTRLILSLIHIYNDDYGTDHHNDRNYCYYCQFCFGNNRFGSDHCFHDNRSDNCFGNRIQQHNACRNHHHRFRTAYTVRSSPL